MKKLGRPPNKRRAAALAARKLTFAPVTRCKRCRTRLRYGEQIQDAFNVQLIVGLRRYAVIADDDAARADYKLSYISMNTLNELAGVASLVCSSAKGVGLATCGRVAGTVLDRDPPLRGNLRKTGFSRSDPHRRRWGSRGSRLKPLIIS